MTRVCHLKIATENAKVNRVMTNIIQNYDLKQSSATFTVKVLRKSYTDF